MIKFSKPLSTCKAVSILLVFLLLIGCDNAQKFNDKHQDSIDRFVENFHSMVNAGNFEKIHDTSAIELKEKIDKPEFVAFMSKVFSILGKPVKTEFIGATDMQSDIGENLIAAQYKTTYSKGSATETFIFRKLEKGMQLFQYNINSDDLMRGLITSH